jgi:hypothetical protein
MELTQPHWAARLFGLKTGVKHTISRDVGAGNFY